LSVKSCVTSGVASKPTTKARSVTQPHGLVEKLDGRFLLELETVRETELLAVDEQSDLPTAGWLGVETADFVGRLVVIDDFEIGLLKIGDAFAALVGHDEDHVHFVGSGADGRKRPIHGSTLVGGWRCLIGWRTVCRGGGGVGCDCCGAVGAESVDCAVAGSPRSEPAPVRLL